MKIKLYCVFAKESILKMGGNRGKMSAQAGHAYLHSFWNALDNDADNDKFIQAKGYQNRTGDGYAYKIALIVDTVDELKLLQEKYKDICGTSLVTDAGFTVFDEPTTTCLGIGPIREDNIGDDIKSLKTFC